MEKDYVERILELPILFKGKGWKCHICHKETKSKEYLHIPIKVSYSKYSFGVGYAHVHLNCLRKEGKWTKA